MKPKKAKKEVAHELIGHRRKVLLIGLGMTFLVLIFWSLNFFEKLENSSKDWRFVRRGPRTAALPMAIVAIDDESLNIWVDEKNNRKMMPDRWTWPRNFYGTVVDNLAQAGARLIAFDITFSEPSMRDPGQDKAFGDACKRAGNVVVPIRYTTKAFGAGQIGLKDETPIKPLRDAMLDMGNVNVSPDFDNHYRGFRVGWYDQKHFDPSRVNLDLALYRQLAFGKAVPPRLEGDNLVLSDGSKTEVIPTLGDGFVLVNYLGPAGTVPTFKFHDVYYKTMDMSIFKGRVVYVGSSSSILHDNHPTPFLNTDADSEEGESAVNMPGVEIHAHLLDTLVSKSFISMPDSRLEPLLILLLGILTSFLTFRTKAKYGGLMVAIILSAYVVLALSLFVGNRLMIPMVAPLASVVASFLGIAVYRGFVEEKRAKETRAMFSRYVSKHIVDEILKNPGAVKLGGEIKETSILFSDVRGFTAMSERLSAPEVVEVLNEYLTRMVDVVIANNGTLDKYVGDAIMAVWGSPLPDPNHQLNAARTAVMMMEVLHELRAKWRTEGKPDIDIGIGINSGHVVAGNMGHPEYKMDYTVIGDDVNLAARLESANKEMKAHVLISGTTYAAVQNLVEVIKHPDIHVKGKEKAVEVYEVIGWKGQGRAEWAVPLKG